MRVLRYKLIARQSDEQGIRELLRGLPLAEFSTPGHGEHQNRRLDSKQESNSSKIFSQHLKKQDLYTAGFFFKRIIFWRLYK